MRRLKKWTAFILVLCMLLQSVLAVAAATTTKPNDGTTTGEPFPKGTAESNSFRIPSLVTLSDGTLVAAADARWNTTYDGGGLDTIVSRSEDDGAAWNYTFANYLGDNGDEYNGSSSTAFIDPALAVTSNDTIYMLCDLYPYGVALNGSGNTAPVATKAFNDAGYLLLSNDNHTSYGFYLKGGSIYNGTTNAVVSGYEVDEYFNITGDDGTDSNLFFSDSPYKVVRTGFLYLTSSTDKGATWSEPTLLNLKTTSELVCLVGPGRGLVTSGGMIVFPVYSYHGDNDPSGNTQRLSFIYSSDGVNWSRTSEYNYNWASEAAVVELGDGTLRFFYRNGTTNLCYVDYNMSSNSWGNAVNTGIVTNSNCQISAITYSKSEEGKQVILVSCPSGPTGGSNQSGASYRLNGKIFVGLVNDDKTISWQTDKTISVDSKHSSTNYFMYSCLTETTDGDIAILYEDNEAGWGTGDDKYYQMTFATYALDIGDEETPDDGTSDEGAIKVELKVGAVYETTDETGDYEASYTGEGLDTNIAQVTVDGLTKEGSTTTEKSIVEMDSNGTYEEYYISDGTNYLVLNGTSLSNTTNYEEATKWTVTRNGNNYTIKSENYYLRARSGRNTYALNVSTSTNYTTWYYSETKGFYYSDRYLKYDDSWKVGRGQPDETVHLYNVVTTTIPGESYTSITITGVKPGKTYVTVGSTKYAITVLKGEVSKTIAVGDTYTCVDASTAIITAPDSAIAKAELFEAELSITAVAVGTTTLETETTKYTINVIDGYAITIKDGESLTISPSDPMGDGSVTGITLEEGQYVEWLSADSSYVGIAGVYDSTNKVYTDEGYLLGHNVTTSAVTVTGTICNADGTKAGTVKWVVKVEEGEEDTNTSSRHIYVNVTEIINCTMYYSVNGGELVEVNGSGVLFDNDITGHFNILFFAKPNDGYVMTYMSLSGTDGQYYSLCDGNPDGTESDAWPFVSATQTTIPSTSGDDAWVTGHGYRWPLLEGNMTIEQMKVLFSNAIALGCDGVTGFTKNGTEGFYTEMQCVAQELAPTLKKEIISITDSTGATTSYAEGTKIEIGDTINYQITITVLPETEGDVYVEESYTPTSPITESNQPEYTTGSYGTVTYSNVVLLDALTDEEWNPALRTSTTTIQTFCYETSVTVAVSNFLRLVKDGVITNVAELQYDCSSSFTKGTMHTSSAAVAEAVVVVPEYVIDFGLPVKISLSNDPLLEGYDTIAKATANYGEVTVNGLELIYTPNKILQGIDYIVLEIVDPSGSSVEAIGYGVRIYPATSVYYEEGFAQGTKGNWISTSKVTELYQSTETVGEKENAYGYDGAYNTIGASNGTSAVSNEASIAKFTFTGTGLDIYTNNSVDSGVLMVWVKNSVGNTVKILQVDTHMESGADGSYFTSGQDVNAYNVPVVTISGLERDTYTVELRHIGQSEDGEIVYKTVSLDGFRVHGTLDVASDEYVADGEGGPVFFELRDCVLAGLMTTEIESEYAESMAADMLAQVYSSEEGTAGAVVLSSYEAVTGETIDVQELLDNGPKNELYLRKGDAIVFKVPVEYEVQVGMKALNETLSYRLNNEEETSIPMNTSTDMFYVVSGVENGDGTQTITITNIDGGILSLTEIKLLASVAGITAEPMMLSLRSRDLIPALMSLGYESEVVEEETQPEQNTGSISESTTTESTTIESTVVEPNTTDTTADTETVTTTVKAETTDDVKDNTESTTDSTTDVTTESITNSNVADVEEVVDETAKADVEVKAPVVASINAIYAAVALFAVSTIVAVILKKRKLI